jgi:outer membrane protein insertion porin family/translocation and assembly module TamA
VLYPLTLGKILGLEESSESVTVLPQLRLRFDLRQPIPFDTRTNARLGGEFNLYNPVVSETIPKREYILGYQTYTGVFGFDRPFFDALVHLGLYFNVEFNNPFSYNENALPLGFDDVFIPSLQAIASLDLRRDAQGNRDAIEPNKGLYVKTDLQFAGRFLRSDADDIRVTPEIRGYIPISKKVTLALRWSTGFVLFNTYKITDKDSKGNEKPPREVCPGKLESCPDTEQARKVQILDLRGYFSGGSNSNRGYSYRGVGPKAKVPSLFGVNGLAPEDPLEAVAIGGLTLWETSAELRFPIALPLGGVVFLDASDVSSKSGDLRSILFFECPHLSAGFGLRYATPVGPARLDIGYRIPGMQVVGACKDDELRNVPEEGVPEKLGGVLPIAVSLAIGEAF